MSSGVDRILDGRAPGGFGQRLPRDLPTAPKPDPLPPEDRAKVEQAIAEGKVTRVPPGRQALADLDMSIEGRRARGRRIAQRHERFRALQRGQDTAEGQDESGGGASPEPERQPAPAADPKACPHRRPLPAVVSRHAQPDPSIHPVKPPEPEPSTPGLVPLGRPSVDTEGAAPVFGWARDCAFELVPVARLSVGYGYQRALSRDGERRIRAIARDFDWARFGAIVVRRVTSESGDRFEVIDGQHRAAAAKARGVREVPAIVVAAEGAAVFLGLNRDRLNLKPTQIYRAELLAGGDEAVRLAEILRDVGLAVPRVGLQKGLGPMQVTAVTVLRSELRGRGAPTLKSALRVLAQAWEAEPGVFCAPMIRAACRAVAEIEAAPDRTRHATAELERLAQTLRRHEPLALLRAAKAAAAEHGGTAHAHLARLICNAHAEAGGVAVAVGV